MPSLNHEAGAIDIIKRSIPLIDAGWCQGAMATTGDGTPVGYNEFEACNFCLMGAMSHIRDISPHDSYNIAYEAVRYAIEEAYPGEAIGNNHLGLDPMAYWQDRSDRTKEQVIGVMQIAMDYLKEEISA